MAQRRPTPLPRAEADARLARGLVTSADDCHAIDTPPRDLVVKPLKLSDVFDAYRADPTLASLAASLSEVDLSPVVIECRRKDKKARSNT